MHMEWVRLSGFRSSHFDSEGMPKGGGFAGNSARRAAKESIRIEQCGSERRYFGMESCLRVLEGKRPSHWLGLLFFLRYAPPSAFPICVSRFFSNSG
ncbi:hypothetical protein GCM10011586_13590 [Silvibacterium dinghuense]|nr:hypothetical protein GCM10011586_13590 [Silvibacterium dinghuense]